MRWTLTGKDNFSAVIRDGQTVIGGVGYYTDEDKANARLAVAAKDAIELLERIVAEEDAKYEQAYRAACAHNNTDGAGVHFDYAPYPAYPEWFDEAREIIYRAKENRL